MKDKCDAKHWQVWIGKFLYKSLRYEDRLKSLSFYDTRGIAKLKHRCVQQYALAKVINSGRDPNSAAQPDVLEEKLNVISYSDEFRAILAKLQYEKAGILNTEALLLWALIRYIKPTVYFESGTGRGYSTRMASEALFQNENNARLYTFGVDNHSIMQVARQNLKDVPFCEMIEGESQNKILPYLESHKDEKIGIFIDGPKGSSDAYLALLKLIDQHSEPLFIAIHDCEAHLPCGFDPQGKWPNGRINPTRSQLELFYQTSGIERTYSLYFMDDDWCVEHQYLNQPIYDLMPDFKPFSFKKSKQVSFGTMLGVLLHRSVQFK